MAMAAAAATAVAATMAAATAVAVATTMAVAAADAKILFYLKAKLSSSLQMLTPVVAATT